MEERLPTVALPVIPREAATHGRFERLLLTVLVIALAAAWPFYVFGGSQLAYGSAVAASALLAAKLASARSQAIILLLVAEVGLLGTEASAELTGNAGSLGTFRLIDITLASSIVALAVSSVRRRAIPIPTSTEVSDPYRTEHGVNLRHKILERIRSPVPMLLLIVVGWALALWIVNGRPLDGIAKTDFRLIGLAAAMWLITRTCRLAWLTDLSSAFAGLAPALSAKALAIYFSSLWVVGTNDRLQASMTEIDGKIRVILIGGDTILILAPAVAAVALTRAKSGLGRWALWFSALASVVGLLVSGTRTGLLVAAVLVAFVIALQRPKDIFRKPSVRAAAVFAALAAVTAAGLVATGTATRFVTPDAPHVGVNFRIDEFHSFFRLPATDILLGQGIGGRFVSKDVNGFPAVTGWSHMFPIWVLLKVGAVGFAATMLAIFLILRRGFARVHQQHPLRDHRVFPLRPDSALGLLILVGLLLMSFSINRIALPEGAILLGLSIGLLPSERLRAV